jgi:thiol-disulfide isomerase/thioredoxin
MSVSRVWRRLLAGTATVALVAGCNVSPPSFRMPSPDVVAQAGLDPCPTSGPAVSGGLPKVTLRCLDGRSKVNLAGLRGPAIVNFWYSACPPCGQEAKYLGEFAASAKGKVTVLGIDSEPYPDPALHFEADRGLHYPSVSDQHLVMGAKLKVGYFPTTYFLDAAGHLAGKPFVAAFASSAQVAQEVKAHLGVSVS